MVTTDTIALLDWWWLNKTTTFATVASTRTYQPVSGQVSSWWSFVDETNNQPLEIIGPDRYDLLDIDRSITGAAAAVFIDGMDATTGYPVISLYRIPDSANTIRARYRIDIPEFTSANDDTDLSVLGFPRIMENVLIHGAAALTLEENGDESQSGREWGHHARSLKAAKLQNLNMQGNRTYIPNDIASDFFGLRITSDIETAA